MLPEKFLDRMERMLGERYQEFLRSYQEEPCRALRVNTLKGPKEAFLRQAPFSLSPVPWCPDGFYYPKEERPGRHPYHDAGLYYIQEASAMAPVEYLAPRPGERVLDLCAAPGGKSTQIAAAMGQQGLLVSNEIHPARAKILSENMERMGVQNGIVTNEMPQRLAQKLEGFFDRILVDAPCSGEGMFRKNPEAGEEWSLSNIRMCAKRQQEILSCAARMLKPGGRLVYSTCTFAPEEDEEGIRRFLLSHREFQAVTLRRFPGMAAGEPRWDGLFSQTPGELEDLDALRGMGELKDADVLRRPGDSKRWEEAISQTVRLWPHKLKGEGHFVAALQKAASPAFGQAEDRARLEANGWAKEGGFSSYGKKARQKKGRSSAEGLTEKECREYLEFQKQFLKDVCFSGNYRMYGEQLYVTPKGAPSLAGLKVLRPGLHLGTVRKGRFEPSHALALTLSASQASHVWNLPADSPQMEAYLTGAALTAEGEKGWYLITVDGYAIGWGKLSGNTMKNHYPKGLRK